MEAGGHLAAASAGSALTLQHARPLAPQELNDRLDQARSSDQNDVQFAIMLPRDIADLEEVDVSEVGRKFDLERTGRPLDADPVTLFDLPPADLAFDEDIAIHFEDARSENIARTEEERFERPSFTASEVLILGIVHLPECIIGSEMLEVVADLMGNRLEEFFLPIPIIPAAGKLEKRAIIEHDAGTNFTRPAEIGWVGFRQALAERVDLRERGMENGSSLDFQTIDALPIRRRNGVEDLLSTRFELGEIHENIDQPPPGTRAIPVACCATSTLATRSRVPRSITSTRPGSDPTPSAVIKT